MQPFLQEGEGSARTAIVKQTEIPLLDLKAQHDPIRVQIIQAIERVIESQAFINGPDVQRLEQRIAAYSGAAYGIGVSSGTDALLVSLMALEIGPGDEVILPDYSFFATAGVVSRIGGKPVFVDIDPATYNIDSGKIETAITKKTKAIIPVHLFGQCADMDPVLTIAHKYNLKVIEDAAQAIGAEYKDGRRAGSMGDIGCFSFFPSKNLGSFGDGGMVVTNDGNLAEKVRILSTHGAQPKYYHKVIGGNFRLDTIQAAIISVKLDYLENWTKKRQENAALYRKLFHEMELTDRIVKLPKGIYEDSKAKHAHMYNQFCVRLPKRDELRKNLQEQGIGSEVYYPVPFHAQECFQVLGYARNDFPQSQAAADESLALPIYPGLSPSQMQLVVQAINRYYLS